MTVVVVLVLVSCGSESSESPAGSTSTVGAVGLPGGSGGSSSVVGRGAPVGGDLPDLAVGVDDATGLGVRFGWSGGVLACVGERLGLDSDGLVVAASGGAGSDVSAALVEAGLDCQQVLEWAPAFAASMAEAYEGSLTDEQVACLEREWASLDRKVIDELVAGAVAPAEQTREAAVAVEQVRDTCEL